MENILNHNGKIVRLDGNIFRIIAQKLGKRVLVDAECIFGAAKGTVVNLRDSRAKVALAIRKAINLNLVS